MFGSRFYMATLIYNRTKSENAKHKGLVRGFLSFCFFGLCFCFFFVFFFLQRS